MDSDKDGGADWMQVYSAGMCMVCYIFWKRDVQCVIDVVLSCF